MLLVVHIPKTAGTSLRHALGAQFGARRIACDYGADSTATTREVMARLYARDADRDIPVLVNQLKASGYKVLMGHFAVARYAACFPPEQMLAFVREPLARMCSEYLHRYRQGRYASSFSEFVEEPWFRNMQSGMLRNRPDGMFIGLAEQYEESLRCISERFGLNLGSKKRNRGPKGGGARMIQELSPEVVERFYALNQADTSLYREAQAGFEKLTGRWTLQESPPSTRGRLISGVD